jgi:hypothetical protein
MVRDRDRDEALGDVLGDVHGEALPDGLAEALAEDNGRCWLNVAEMLDRGCAAASAGGCRGSWIVVEMIQSPTLYQLISNQLIRSRRWAVKSWW